MGKIDWETLTDTQARRKKATDVLYNQNKFVCQFFLFCFVFSYSEFCHRQMLFLRWNLEGGTVLMESCRLLCIQVSSFLLQPIVGY
jgi:hypothetical protein